MHVSSFGVFLLYISLAFNLVLEAQVHDIIGVPRSFHAYIPCIQPCFHWFASSLLAMSLIPIDPTQIDHHASYHSPLHPLRGYEPRFDQSVRL